MEDRIVLVYDVGTQSSRALLVNQCGEILGKSKVGYPNLFEKIEGVSITTIRDTVVCVDREGRPLRPAILWLDKRRASGKPRMSQISRMLFKAVGMEGTANVQYQKSHCNWIRQKEPDLWNKTYKYLLLSGYLIFRLCGRMADSAASLVGHIPFDSQSRGWQKMIRRSKSIL